MSIPNRHNARFKKVQPLLCFVVALVGLTVLPLAGQNLLSNGGFEVFRGPIPCGWVVEPNEFNVNSWYIPTRTTPDIHSAFVGPNCPNYIGSGNKTGLKPHRGQSALGLFTYGFSKGQGSWREYVQTQLVMPIVPGKPYLLEAWICLKPSSSIASGNLGFYFSIDRPHQSSYKPLDFNPQIECTELLSTKGKWYRFFDTVVFSEPYRYLTIGNFRTDKDTRFEAIEPSNDPPLDIMYQVKQRAYYLIDDVALWPLDAQMADYLKKNQQEIDLITQVHFGHDRFDLEPEMENRLKRLYRYLSEQPQVRIMLAGHTDSVGITDYNMNLSEKRAMQVRLYLLAQGLASERILTKWYGPHRPAADNSTPEGRYLNRRVVIELIR